MPRSLRLLVLITVIIFIFSNVIFAKTKEQLYEESLKRSAEASDFLNNWTANIPTNEARVTFGVSNVSRTGDVSATIKVEDDGPQSASFYEFYKDVPCVKPGEVYKMTAWIKTENQANGVGAYMGVGALKPEYPYERFVSGDSERITGNSDWTKVSCILFVPEGVHAIRQIILIHGTGQAYFDDIKLEKINTLESADKKTVKIEVTNEVTTDDFIGFGFEDDAFFYTKENLEEVNDTDIKMRNERIAELNPSVVATLFWWDAISPTRDINNITYDTEQMKALIRTLRPHADAGRKVFMGDVHWGWNKDNFTYNAANVEKGAKAYADAIKYLIKEQGLDCLKYICVSGEVDMVFEKLGGSFETYMQACRILRAELDKAGLNDIKIIGDKSGGFVWIENIIPIMDDVFEIYTIHEYPEVTQYPLIDYRIDKMIDIVQRTSKPISTACGKTKYEPIFLYEIGALDGKTMGIPSQMGSVMPTYEYSLYCANTAISGLNRGLVGGSVWCLHSMYYPGKSQMDFGIWEFKDKNWQTRPVYYGYGLFCKYTRPGMKPLKTNVSPNLYDVSAAVLKDCNDNKIVYLLNMSPNNIKAKISGLGKDTYQVYEYTRDNIPQMTDPNYAKIEALNTHKKWNASTGKIKLKAQSIIMLK